MIERPSYEQLKDQQFRNAFLARTVRESVAAQVKTLRKQYRLSLREFARRCGFSYGTAFRLEHPLLNAGTTIKTLLTIASAFDVALIVKFVSWSRFLQEMFIVLPDGTLEYLTETIEPSEDVLRLMEWANA